MKNHLLSRNRIRQEFGHVARPKQPEFLANSATALIAIICCACFAHAETNKTEANRVIEIELRSETQYKNPFTEIEIDAIVTQPNGKQLRIPGFWAGGSLVFSIRVESNRQAHVAHGMHRREKRETERDERRHHCRQVRR